MAAPSKSLWSRLNPFSKFEPVQKVTPLRPGEKSERELIDGMIEKASKSPAATGPLSGDVVRDGMFKHAIDQRAMILSVNNNWMLGSAIDKIVQEATKEIDRVKDLFVPKFEKKCEDCGEEHQYDIAICEQCGSPNLRDPDFTQIERVVKFLEHPNSDVEGRVQQSLKDIVRALVFYMQVTDDYYLEVVPALDGAPAEMFALSAEYIRVAARAGKYAGRFCELCWNAETNDKTYPYGDPRYESCPECSRPLVDTAYVQIGDADRIVGRFSTKRLLHDRARGFGRRIYGISKIESVWAAAQTLRWMELFQWSTYSNNKSINSIIYIPQLSQEEIFDLQDQILERKRITPNVPQHLWIGGGGREGSGTPAVIDAMPTLVDLNAKEMALFLREAIAIRYGVSLNMLGVQVPGKLGKETEIVEVSYDTIEEVQSQIEDFFIYKLIPMFTVTKLEGGKIPEVQDFRFELPSPKRDDVLRKEQVEQLRIQKAMMLNQMGYMTEFDDEFNVRIVGENPIMPLEPYPENPEAEQQMMEEQAMRQQGEPVEELTAMGALAEAEEKAFRGMAINPDEDEPPVKPGRVYGTKKPSLERLEESGRVEGGIKPEDVGNPPPVPAEMLALHEHKGDPCTICGHRQEPLMSLREMAGTADK